MSGSTCQICGAEIEGADWVDCDGGYICGACSSYEYDDEAFLDAMDEPFS